MRPTLTRREFSIKEFYSLLEDALNNFKQIKTAKQHQLVSKDFSNRIMLAVTKVNGCRLCNYLHTKNALKSGMTATEIQALVAGDLDNVPADEAVALIFAQHYAETKAKPAPEAYQRLLTIWYSCRSAVIV